MQGPTPVSSLLHAGPILLFKVSSIVNYNISLAVLLVCLIQSDIKGIIIDNSISQLVIIISIAANLHITTHACLFMVV